MWFFSEIGADGSFPDIPPQAVVVHLKDAVNKYEGKAKFLLTDSPEPLWMNIKRRDRFTNYQFFIVTSNYERFYSEKSLENPRPVIIHHIFGDLPEIAYIHFADGRKYEASDFRAFKITREVTLENWRNRIFITVPHTSQVYSAELREALETDGTRTSKGKEICTHWKNQELVWEQELVSIKKCKNLSNFVARIQLII